MDDQSLVAQIRMGDEHAFTWLFRRYYPLLVPFAATFVPSLDDAQEIVNDLFVQIWERRDTLNIHGRVDHYLYSAVRNRVRNHLRDERRLADRHEAAALEEEVPWMGEAVAPIDATLELQEQMRAVWNAVAALPEARRRIVLLRWQRQMSFEEIAQILGTTSAAVQMQLSRAMKMLREMLPDAFEE